MRATDRATGNLGRRKAALFVLILIPLIILSDRLIGCALDAIHDGYPAGRPMDKLSRFLSQPQTPFYTIVGSSKAGHDVMPKAFHRPAFNLGYDGNYLLFSAGTVSLLESRRRLGPVLLLHIDQKLFVAGKAPDYLQSDLRSLKVYYGRVPWITSHIDSLPWTERIKFLFSSYRYNGYLYDVGKYLLQRTAGHAMDWDGYEPLPPEAGDRARLVYDSERERENFSRAIGLDRGPLDLLAGITETCKRNHTRLICFSAPHYADQRAQYAPIHALLDSALASEGVPFLDYLAAAPGIVADPGLWKDLTHLNADGAALFSRDLGGKVDSLLANFPP